jgi:hypothetical protein
MSTRDRIMYVSVIVLTLVLMIIFYPTGCIYDRIRKLMGWS